MSEIGPILVIILQLIFLEGILSIDNAAVIGALVGLWLYGMSINVFSQIAARPAAPAAPNRVPPIGCGASSNTAHGERISRQRSLRST